MLHPLEGLLMNKVHHMDKAGGTNRFLKEKTEEVGHRELQC